MTARGEGKGFKSPSPRGRPSRRSETSSPLSSLWLLCHVAEDVQLHAQVGVPFPPPPQSRGSKAGHRSQSPLEGHPEITQHPCPWGLRGFWNSPYFSRVQESERVCGALSRRLSHASAVGLHSAPLTSLELVPMCRDGSRSEREGRTRDKERLPWAPTHLPNSGHPGAFCFHDSERGLGERRNSDLNLPVRGDLGKVTEPCQASVLSWPWA